MSLTDLRASRLSPVDVTILLLSAGLVLAAGNITVRYLAGLPTIEVPLTMATIMALSSAFAIKTVADDAEPEFDTTCAVCEEEVVVDSASPGFDHAILVRASSCPDRYGLAPLVSVRRRDGDTVCSPACAEEYIESYQEYANTAHRVLSTDAPPQTEVSE